MMRRPKIILPLFSFFFFIIIIIAGSESARYFPDDNIALDCGSPDNLTSPDDRKWTGDRNNKDSRFSLAERNSSSSSRATEQKSSVETVPYMTARISRSNFSYSFRVSVPGPKFIRLHFYPAVYEPNLDLTDSFFSVRAGEFTLLKNFSSSMFAEHSDSPAFAREFCVYVKESDPQSINLEFIPSSSSSYAFVNAIEIVSMPTELYYAPEGEPLKSPKSLGIGGGFFQSYGDRALETVHRVNVGGRTISRSEDTGMFREWSRDDSFFISSGFVPFNTSMALNYSVTPNYTAPDEVYRTATSMGPDAERNKRSNLTWDLPVDRRFFYLVRLHFCMLSEQVAEAGPEAQFFYVFVNDWTAENQGNLDWWTGGRGLGVPVYKDYVVNVLDKDSIFISLTTRPEKSIYDDASLNGIEVFKMSSAAEQSLAGPNPAVNITRNGDKLPAYLKESDSKRRVLILASSLAAAGFVFFVAVTAAVLYMMLVVRRRNKPRSSSKSKSGSKLPEELCRHFYLWEIEEATEGFSEDRVVGRGAFGKVYKGFIDGDKSKSNIVAVKRLNRSSENHQGENEFVAEIKFLSRLRHVNLVSLVGYCDEEGEMILVYAFVANGTLREHLYGDEAVPLAWRARLEACLGAARGLQYLHAGFSGAAVIHRDVKTANILLDENWVAKVADFGLSRVGQTGGGAVSTVVKGTPGYLDPEYYNRQKLVDKSDVYSFGVVLFEALCGRKPIDFRLEDEKRSLSAWVRKCARDGTVNNVVDPFLKGKIAPECLRTFVEVADSCLRDMWDPRPSMRDVVEHLEFALKLQLEADAAADVGHHSYPEVPFRIVDEYDLLGLRSAADGDGASFVSLETQTADVFSRTTAHDSRSKLL